MSPPDVRRGALDRSEKRSPDRSTTQEFRRTVDYLSAVLECSPEPVLVLDRTRRVDYANPAVEALLGWRAKELFRTPIANFVVQADQLEGSASERLTEQAVVRRELEVFRSDGTSCWMSISASPLRLPSGRLVGTVLFLRDERECRRTRLELARKNAELEQTVRAVSHDLRSPLVAVLGFSRLLREDFVDRLDEKGRHFLEQIEKSARTMEALIGDFLELSRIGHEQGTAPALCDPREVLWQLKAELKPKLDARRVELQLPPELPLIRCDRTRLYQVFSNLIGNALDHMGQTLGPRIRVGVSEEPSAYHITVRDNGQGIDPDHHDRIFEIFQGLKPAGASEGTGVGLAIVRKIAEVHGGHAWVESRAGEGATFHVTLARH
jgi:two-component system sensor kinase FixL